MKKNIIITILAILMISFIALAYIFYSKFSVQKQHVQDGYNRAMYDFVSDINNIENEITKLKITSEDNYILTTLASVFAKANSAKANLDILPFSVESVQNVSKFLNQLSDFSYSLMRDIIAGESIEEYKDEIDLVYSKIQDLNKVTTEIYDELNNGRIRWDELKEIGEEKIDSSDVEKELSSANKIGKTFTEYEGLIYDGAFSNHILTREPEYLKDGKEVTVEEAQKILNEKMNLCYCNFLYEQETELKMYVFECRTVESDTLKIVYVTAIDGKIFQMIADRNVSENNIDIKEAKSIAGKYLNSLGIDNIVPTYYLTIENIVTISFASVQDNVVIYSDLIKVKVALDNGEILGIETGGYIYNHQERQIDTKYSALEARERLYNELNIESEQLCIIPNDSKKEVVSYEFKGSIDNHKFLVYINANTLQEEKIYILLETPGGTLAI